MKEKLLKYWKDPVWSKIIAGVIFSFLTICYNFFKAHFDKTDFITEFKIFWNTEIRLWIFILIFLLIYFLYFIKSYLIKKDKFQYDNETLELDRNLFNRIRSELFTTENFYNLKEHLFSSQRFESNKSDFAYLLIVENDKPEFEFLNSELEKAKIDFIESLKNFEKSTTHHIYTAEPLGFMAIPREWDDDRFENAVKEISLSEKDICEKFEILIKKGRRILKI